MCAGLLNLKCYFLMLPPGMVEREAAHLVHTPDVIVPDRDGPLSFCGAEFQILQTPGHSAGHIAIQTPDRVCHQAGIESREKLRDVDADFFVMAHRGMCRREELSALIDDNQALAQRRAGEVLSQITGPMTISEITRAVCGYFKLLTKKPSRALRFERNIRFFVEYLVDRGDLILETDQGVAVYRPADRREAP